MESSYESSSIERSKYGVDYDNNNIEAISSKEESSYESKNGASAESRYSKTIANGSAVGAYESVKTAESVKTISKSESNDGKPAFSKTLQGQNIERK